MRTIQYFYNLDKEKSRLMMAAICAECEVSPSTAYKWMQGTRKPGAQDQKFIQKQVKKHYNVSVPRKELFA
jgi:hypothetical protein